MTSSNFESTVAFGHLYLANFRPRSVRNGRIYFMLNCTWFPFSYDGPQPLLGWPAIKSLSVLINIQSLSENAFVQKYLGMFTGLGTMICRYNIKLKDGAKPFCLTAPRRVPLLLQSAVNDEIKRMLDNNVITPVTKPTDWCAGMAAVPKKDGQVRICVGYTPLNKNVLRERHLLFCC